MKFAIFGAGAIGALVGSRLIVSGEEVALIARGPHLAAMRERGLVIRSQVFGDYDCKPFATDNLESVGPVDFLILAVKAHGLRGIAPQLAPLLGEETAIVTAQNGIPWWYLDGLEQPWANERLESVDPGGVIASHIEARRVIGSIVYASSAITNPGVVEHVEGSRFLLGEPDGSRSERVRRLTNAFSAGGLKASIRSDIRADIWVKVQGNAAFNPISALTRATLQGLLRFPPTRELARAAMEEVVAVAASLGIKMTVSVDRRLAGADKVGDHKTSMLQDLEAGRPLEVDPIVGAVIELGDRVGVKTPTLGALYACTKLLEREQG